MSELSIERKAELFDYLSTRVSEMKLDGDWVYNDKRTAENFAEVTISHMEMEAECDDEDEE